MFPLSAPEVDCELSGCSWPCCLEVYKRSGVETKFSPTSVCVLASGSLHNKQATL